jgi:hypothetical protein
MSEVKPSRIFWSFALAAGLVLVAATSVAVAAAAPATPPCGSTTEGGPEGPPLGEEDVCATVVPQVGDLTNPAVQDPDRFAWKLFSEINAPAGPGPGGSPAVVWQTWANQADVYVANPNPDDPPQWDAVANRHQEPLRLKPFTHQHRLGDILTLQAAHERADAKNPCNPAPTSDQLLEEVRMNRDTVDYIGENRLWYIEGQIEAFETGFTVSFPTGSREVKANWIPIAAADKARFHWTSSPSGQLYGLVALHVLSKDLPNWFWATFEHAANPCWGKYLAPQDDFGFPDGSKITPQLEAMFREYGLDPALWSQYRLDGAQVDFTDSTGRPILLGNSLTELGFQTTASCMTCHSRSTVAADTSGPQTGRLSVFDNNNVWQGQAQSFHGTPNPSWFWSFAGSTPTRKYLQLDFVWSLFCANAIGSTQQQQFCPAPAVD